MTVLTAASNASKLLGKGAISALFTSTDPFHIELTALCDDVATDIFKRHDWQKLLTLKTVSGVGSDEVLAVTLPTDYDRFQVVGNVFEETLTGLQRIMPQAKDTTEWRIHITSPASFRKWILIGNVLSIFPDLTVDENDDPNLFARFYYISNWIVDPASGSDHAVPFTLDTDSFVLSERLLTLGLVWRWRQMKGLDYAEDMQAFEMALSQEVGRDRAPAIRYVGSVRLPDGVELAYPGTITP